MHIRTMKMSDIEAVIAIENQVWGAGGASAGQIRSRQEICPEGSVVAEHINGEIAGYAAAQRISSLGQQTWAQVTDNGTLRTTHVPDGPIAFGVGMSVLPQAARFGVSGLIIQHYARTFIAEGGCQLMTLGSRLPGYARWKEQHGGSVQAYLDTSRRGRSVDPELCLYQKAGFGLLWPVRSYFPDPASLDWGAIIAMPRATALELAK